MKKLLALLALLLAVVMVLSLAACSSSSASTPAAPADDSAAAAPAQDSSPELEPVTLKMWFHGSNVTPEASEKVMEEVNAYLKDKINVTLEPIWGTWGDFNDSVVTALTGGDEVDIYFTCNWSGDEYNKYARNGYWVKLDDLLPQYGADLLATIPEGIWECAKTNGIEGNGIYAVPGLKDTATQYCFDVNGTLLADLGYNVDEVCAAGLDMYSDEFEEMLQKAKEAKGDNFYPLVMEPLVLERIGTTTSIITGASTLLSYYYDAEHPSNDTGAKLVNKYATDEFKRYADRVYYLAQKGYISPQTQNTATYAEYRNSAQATGDYLFNTLPYAFGCELDYSNARGIDVRVVPCDAPFMDATSGQGAMMAISVTSKNPERALMLLNLLNTDPELMTLVNYGVEGYTYEKKDDGTIAFIDGNRANYSPWTNGVGNVRILPPTDAQGVDFWDRFSAYYDTAEALPIGGFVFDPSDYEQEMAALSNVYSEYGHNIMSGAVDPDTALPEFLAKLEEAGIDKVVAGAQEQLDAYRAG